jgi:uncharacterized protein with PQ loop repeat
LIEEPNPQQASPFLHLILLTVIHQQRYAMPWPCWAVEATDFIIGCGFLLGLILQNVPQHYQCWKHRSAQGLSLGYILICTVSNVTITLASLMGDYHIIIDAATNLTAAADGMDIDDDLWNNTEVSNSRSLLQDGVGSDSSTSRSQALEQVLFRIFATMNACMPTMQNFMSILVGVPSLIFYYFLFSKAQPYLPTRHRRPSSQQPLLSQMTESTLSLTDDEDEQDTAVSASPEVSIVSRRYYYSDGTEFRIGVILTILAWLVCVVCFILSGVVLAVDSTAWETTLLQVWGSTAAITNIFLYVPQIVTTWRNQHEGVLSMASLWISVAGDVALCIFWIVASNETVWVYASNIADAGMQLILIGMILDFRKKRARQRTEELGDYGFVYNVSGDQDYHTENISNRKPGEIEVVYGEVLEIYSRAASALELLYESSTIQTTTHGAVDQASREFLI